MGSVNVFEWFKYRTFYASQFARTSALVKEKNRLKLRISLGIPTLNEEKNIGRLVRKLRKELVVKQPLLDEIVVIDSGSTDRTVSRARAAGASVFVAERVLGSKSVFRGKGENLWKSLHVLDGDIIVWLDADIKNFDNAMITGLVGPLLEHPDILFVKGFFDRHLKIGSAVQPQEGGRTTEIFVRPFLNLFFPPSDGFRPAALGSGRGEAQGFRTSRFFLGVWGRNRASGRHRGEMGIKRHGADLFGHARAHQSFQQ